MQKNNIDSGKAFDWGRVSEDYARYRDIYPDIFYEKITTRNLCVNGQSVLDLGTGTGVLPRNMYRYGAKWTGADISVNQIEQARKISAQLKQDIQYIAAPAETLDFEEDSFDVITACQCFWYFDHEKIAPKLSRMLKKNGRLLILYMAWLPYEDEVYHEEYPLEVHFTRESWNGRMKACRGVGASLSEEELSKWESEHKALLERIAPESFTVKHYAALLEMKVRL